MNNAQLLIKLNKKWHKNINIGLKDKATRSVFGDGNTKAKIVFIGEAPGKKEDETGKPFVGSAGKLLDKLLESISLKREDIYITNIIKYRPPENRDPTKSEIEVSLVWLKEELNIIKPKIIVFLGRHSLNTFFSDKKISDVHGKIINQKVDDLFTNYFLPLYHPAAALYNGKLQKTLFKDFLTLKKFIKKI